MFCFGFVLMKGEVAPREPSRKRLCQACVISTVAADRGAMSSFFLLLKLIEVGFYVALFANTALSGFHNFTQK